MIAIIFGSKSDWPIMVHAANTLDGFKIPYEKRIISAHRTPDMLFEYVAGAEDRGIEIIIAGAGGAAHLPGMAASKTHLPVLGVPIECKLQGMDALLSIVQMPKGVPVATFAIGRTGAINAALFAVGILAGKNPDYRTALLEYRKKQTKKVVDESYYWE